MTDLRTLLRVGEREEISSLDFEALLRGAKRRTNRRRLAAVMSAAGLLIAALLAISSLRNVTGIDIDTIQPADPAEQETQKEEAQVGPGNPLPPAATSPKQATAKSQSQSGGASETQTQSLATLDRFAWNSDNGSGGYGILTMNSDGSGRRLISKYGLGPDWSPDGKKVAFHWFACDTCLESIHVVRADGTDRRDLGALGSYPKWAPDGSQLVFSMEGTGSGNGRCQVANTCSIGVVNVDGTGYRRLSAGYGPHWGPDGRIVYQELVPNQAAACDLPTVAGAACDSPIWIMNSDGSARRSLGVVGQAPKWSPDGKRIVFYTSRSGIQIVNSDGTNHRSLTPGGYAQPDWMPDNQNLLVIRYISSWELFTMVIDGEGERRWTFDGVDDALPSVARPGRP